MNILMVACAVFVGSHFLMSHPLRAAMVARFGEQGFLGVYSLLSLASFGWVASAFARAPATAPLWAVSDGLWVLATVIMLCAMILLIGSFIKNPAVPDPNAAAHLSRPIAGVFAITRHPMMWAFGLWGGAHIAVAPMLADIVLCGSLSFLALVGAMAQEHKKRRFMGAQWSAYEARTSYWPFALQLTGKARWCDAVPSGRVLGAGVALWLLATYAHGSIGAGIWRWIG